LSATRYHAEGPQTEFEPGSRGRVLRNKLCIIRVGEMQQAESEALEAVQEWAIANFGPHHRFTAGDICQLHRRWLGNIYEWAGDYRAVNMTKDGFMFAAAGQVPRLMVEWERDTLRPETPCSGMDPQRLAHALARTHAELVIIHPFREGNGRCARLLAWLMAMQAGWPTLDFAPLAGRGKGALYRRDPRGLCRELCAAGSLLQGRYAPDFAALRPGPVMDFPALANGLRMPSTADELAAAIRSAVARFLGSRNQGLVCCRVVLIGYCPHVSAQRRF